MHGDDGDDPQRHCRIGIAFRRLSVVSWLKPSGIAVACNLAIIGGIAASLHVASEVPEQRVKKSAEQTEGLVCCLVSAKMTKKDKEQCCAIVVPDERTMAADRCRLLDTINETKAVRRNGSKWEASKQT